MPTTDDELPTTPAEWMEFLLPRLNEQYREALFYRNYYSGIHRIAYATARFREIFGRFFPAAADNWMQVVIDSCNERLTVQGFRNTEKVTNAKAWEVWRENKMPLKSKVLFREAMKTGQSYLLVDNTVTPTRITVESPLECIVYSDPATGERLAGLKRFIGADKHAYVIVYLSDRFVKYRSKGQVRSSTGRPSYEPMDANATEEGTPHTLGVVPLIPVENDPDLHLGGTSDLDVVIPLQDRVNKLCLDLDVGSEFHAAPQRWATGWEPPTDEKGNPLPEAKIEAATSRFLAFKNEEAKVGQLPAGDPTAYIGPIEMYVQHIAALSHTPPHYLLGKMVNISGDALKAAETGLVAKSLTKHTYFGDPIEEAMVLAIDDEEKLETIWKDPEARTFGQLVDGVVKLRSELALPLEMSWEIIGLSPEEIARAKRLIGLPERDFQALDRGMAERQKEQAANERLAAAGRNGNNGGSDSPPVDQAAAAKAAADRANGR